MSQKWFSPSWAAMKPSFTFPECWQFVWGERCELSPCVCIHWEDRESVLKKKIKKLSVYTRGWGNESELNCEELSQQFMSSLKKIDSWICYHFPPSPWENTLPLTPCLPDECGLLGNRSSRFLSAAEVVAGWIVSPQNSSVEVLTPSSTECDLI